jgi:predicted dehydrogenase
MSRGTALLIGFGSIGKVHFQTASDFFSEIIVIDPSQAKFNEFNHLKSQYRVKGFFHPSINQIPTQTKIDFCVIANWGPDHFRAFKEVVDLGCKLFLIEKPLTSSLYDLYEIRKLAISLNLKVVANLQTNFSGFSESVIDSSLHFNLGEIQGMQVSGGAKCVATNGIHYLALASQLFEEWPVSVIADLRSDPINPRSKELLFIDGMASWAYPTNRKLSIHFHNGSRLSTSFRVILEKGYVEVLNNTYRVYGIDSEILNGFTKPVHTASATTLLSEGDAFESIGTATPIQKLYRALIEGDHRLTLDVGFHATEGILGALISSSLGVKVKLGDLETEHPEYFKTDWKIS